MTTRVNWSKTMLTNDTHVPQRVLVSSLVGKTITKAMMMKDPLYADEGNLSLEFSDGTTALIVAYHGGYSVDARDELCTFIKIVDKDDAVTEELNTWRYK